MNAALLAFSAAALACAGCGDFAGRDRAAGSGGLRDRIERTFAASEMHRERSLKFLEIYERLKDNPALGADGREDDLAKFRRSFETAFERWRSDPHNPEVSPRKFNVADFGAKGDGKTCNCEAFGKALSAVNALKGEPSILRIPAGEYFFSGKTANGCPPWAPAFINCNGITNCMITGESPETTKFVFGDADINGILLLESQNITLANMEIRWKNCPFSQGVIEKVDFATDPHSLIIRHTPGTKRPDDPHYQKARKAQVCGLFKADGHQQLGSPAFYDSLSPQPADDLGGGRYRIRIDKTHVDAYRNAEFHVGGTVVIPDRYVGTGVTCWRASFCYFDSIWVRNAPGAAFTTTSADDVVAWKVQVFPEKPEYRLSTNADAFFNVPGTFIAHCRFRNMNDDGANCHYNGSPVYEVIGKRTLRSKEIGGFGTIQPGDPVLIYRAKTSECIARLHVESTGRVRINGVTYREIVAREDIPNGILTQKSLGVGELTKEQRLSLSHGVGKKPDTFADIVYTPHGHGIGYVVSDCEMGDFRGIAVNIQCSHALIESNRFDNCNNGVQISSLMNWYEGLPGNNIVIRGNEMKHLRRGVGAYVDCVLGTRAKGEHIRDLLIVDNVFEDMIKPISLSNVGTSVERGNAVK